MADIFFSYSSTDRERVRPIHDALTAQGFEVFWDQNNPAGVDWGEWLIQHLTGSKCAVVFWTAASARSPNVRHEAIIARDQRKLIQVLLEPLTNLQVPMGFIVEQAVNLSEWQGDIGHEEWRKLSSEIEAKLKLLMPRWVQRRMGELNAELHVQHTLRGQAEDWERTWKERLAKEATRAQSLERERNETVDKAEALRSTMEELSHGKSESDARASELSQRLSEAETQLSQERDHAAEVAAALKAEIETSGRTRSESDARASELSQRLSEAETELQTAQNRAATLYLKVERLRHARPERTWSIGGRFAQVAAIVAALATVGFWTYQLMQPDLSTGGTLKAQVEAADLSQRLGNAEKQRQVAQRQVADLSQQLKGAQTALGDAQVKIDSLTRAKADSDNQLAALIQKKAAETQLNKVNDRTTQLSANNFNIVNRNFTIRTNTVANGVQSRPPLFEISAITCKQSCEEDPLCKVFSYGKSTVDKGRCFLYSKAEFSSNDRFDTGVRILP